MSAISFNAPYAPQPVISAQGAGLTPGVSTALPPAKSTSSNSTNMGSHHSGQGAANGTGTGGAHLAAILKRTQAAMPLADASPKSVVEARAQSVEKRDFANEQLQRQAESKAFQEALAAERLADKAAAAAEAAAKAAEPEFQLPNPLPTAPILERG